MRADPQASAIFWVAAFSGRMIFSFKAPWATSPSPEPLETQGVFGLVYPLKLLAVPRVA